MSVNEEDFDIPVPDPYEQKVQQVELVQPVAVEMEIDGDGNPKWFNDTVFSPFKIEDLMSELDVDPYTAEDHVKWPAEATKLRYSEPIGTSVLREVNSRPTLYLMRERCTIRIPMYKTPTNN